MNQVRAPAAGTPAPNRIAAPTTPRERRMTLANTKQGVVKGPQRLLIYGVGGIGKSTFVSEMPAPVFVDTQEGTEKIDTNRFPRPLVWQDVLDACDELLEKPHAYKTFAIDVLDDIELLIFAHICKRDNKANITAYGFGKGFDVALVEWRILFARLDRLRREKGMSIALVAHTSVKNNKNPEGEDYGRHALNINEKAAGFIRGWCDTVLFAREEVVTRTTERKTRGISTGTRLIHTVETAAYYAKNRDNLPNTLPLDCATFLAAVESGQPADPQAIRAEIEELLESAEPDVAEKARALVAKAPDDAARLVRVLNRVRERVTQQQSQESEEGQS
jgi:hypothetical protein